MNILAVTEFLLINRKNLQKNKLSWQLFQCDIFTTFEFNCGFSQIGMSDPRVHCKKNSCTENRADCGEKENIINIYKSY